MSLVPIRYRSEYYAWHNMKQRCLNPRNKNYYHYGARGIKICDHWRYSFKNFLADLGRKPSQRHSLGIAKTMMAIMSPRIAGGLHPKNNHKIHGNNKLTESKRCGEPLAASHSNMMVQIYFKETKSLHGYAVSRCNKRFVRSVKVSAGNCSARMS
jgi:hypothetical protein